ncbi:MAG: sigma-70 family RNA polymerase sigma factor [Solirubrobacterales bacterium]|nr:sigma-70 family RNA polymerase sigma factor [Solirubrobacterales bacterium]
MSESTRRVRSDRVGLPGRLLSDRALASRIAGGDPAACDELFRRYHQSIYRFCSAMVGPEEAKDVLQIVMTKAMTSMPQDEEIQMKPWLYRVARNECVDQMRKARRTTPGLDPDAQPDSSGSLDPHRAAVERERLDQLVEDLNELPEKQRASLVMRELSGLSYSEIAGSTGTSETAAKQLVYEARLSLQQADLGRKLDCAEVRESISDQDRRRLRARKVRAHLRACRECSDFESSISSRQAGYQSLFPVLPLGASLGILEAIHSGGSVAGAGAGGAAAATTGGVLSGGVATGVIAKGAAVLVVAGGIGVGTAEVVKNRSETGSVGQQAQATRTDRSGFGTATKADGSPAVISASDPRRVEGGRDSDGDGPKGSRTGQSGSEAPSGNGSSPGATTSTADSLTPGSGSGQGPASLPEAASKGQSRADEASSAKPGQTGQAPPSQKPASPPGQSSAGGNSSGGSSNGSSGGSAAAPGKSAEAPAVGKPDSPGKSQK